MPRKIRELLAELKKAGYEPGGGGKGSHRKLKHPLVSGAIIVSGKEGDDAKRYQEAQTAEAIAKAQSAEAEAEAARKAAVAKRKGSKK